MVELLKLAEVARRLGISEPTARRYVKSGKLPSVYIGGSYRVRDTDIDEFLRQARVRPGENLPKGAAPSSAERTLNDVLEEERRAEWDAAVRGARQLREHGRARMEGLLSAWRESRERGEDADARRGYLDEMGELLQHAYDAEMALWSALRTNRLDQVDLEEFAEVQAADRLYLELFRLVETAELSVRPDGAQEGEPAQAGQTEVEAHTVEESEAA